MADVLVFPDDQPTLTATEADQDVLVVREPVRGTTIQSADGDTFVLLDAPTVQSTVVTPVPEFVVFEEPEQPAAVDLNTGGDVLVITTGGGPRGPMGPPGENYFEVFTFAFASTHWVITHNQNTFGLYITTLNNNGEVIDGDVEFPDPNTITVDWYYPVSGVARVFN